MWLKFRAWVLCRLYRLGLYPRRKAFAAEVDAMLGATKRSHYIPPDDNLSGAEFANHEDPARWLVYWVMSRAVDRWGGGNCGLMFNTACFQREWRNQMGIGSWLNGSEVAEMLLRLECATRLPGGAHWQMRPWKLQHGPSVFTPPPADAPQRSRGIA